MSDEVIYLDYNSTTPLHPAIKQQLYDLLAHQPQDYFTPTFGNASTLNQYGLHAKKLIETARGQLATLLKCDPLDLTFTSGGTESNNIVIQGVILASDSQKRHIVSSKFEHPSVVNVLNFAKEHFGAIVQYVDNDKFGLIDYTHLESILTPDTCLVTIMLANNEVGTIQDIERIYHIIQHFNKINNTNIKFHTDAAQAVGKVKVDCQHCDLLSLAGHKFYCMSGVGAFFKKPGITLSKFINGAGQESGIRPGTENFLSIFSLGLAAQISIKDLDQRMEHCNELVDAILKVFQYYKVKFSINGAVDNKLPSTLSIRFDGIDSQSFIQQLSDKVILSAGAACHSGKFYMSDTMKALQMTEQQAKETIRLSVGEGLTKRMVRLAAQEMCKIVLQTQNPRAVFSDYPINVEVKQLVNIAQQSSETLTINKVIANSMTAKPAPADIQSFIQKFKMELIGNKTLYQQSLATYDNSCMCTDQNAQLSIHLWPQFCNDLELFGKTTACSALNGCYSKVCQPIAALQLLVLPHNYSSDEVKILIEASSAKFAEIGICIAGGHTIIGEQLMLGFVILGKPCLKQVVPNYIEVTQGDYYLILTKRLGSGMMLNLMRQQVLDIIERELLITSLLRQNNILLQSSQLEYEHLVASTYLGSAGFLGTLLKMLLERRCSAEIYAQSLPVYANLELYYSQYKQFMVTKEIQDNLQFLDYNQYTLICHNEYLRYVLADTEISSGLLLCCSGYLQANNIATHIGGKIVGRVFASNTLNQIQVMDEVAMDVRMRYGGFFKE